MGLKDLLLQRAGNTGNTDAEARVTGQPPIEQSGNTGSTGNTEKWEGGLGAEEARGEGQKDSHELLFDGATRVTGVTSLKTNAESGNTASPSCVTGVTDPAEWLGEVEDVAAPPAPSSRLRRAPNPPAQGSLVQRLVAAGATVRTWSNGRGGQASIEAPAGISAVLVAEVERRGWRIIPGGKPNPEAEHDSWLVGAPAAELTTTSTKGPTR